MDYKKKNIITSESSVQAKKKKKHPHSEADKNTFIHKL